MLSATYRQSSKPREDGLHSDATNHLRWRMNPPPARRGSLPRFSPGGLRNPAPGGRAGQTPESFLDVERNWAGLPTHMTRPSPSYQAGNQWVESTEAESAPGRSSIVWPMSAYRKSSFARPTFCGYWSGIARTTLDTCPTSRFHDLGCSFYGGKRIATICFGPSE